ncbi:ribosome recycling factor domain-containing protein [Crepidotus variabilis]|uniref:Ribosome recycling factor domain-containing protein n=1 Tax=Crepidotus variabilis TaxID=179855 RepID=A0A9P6EER6_9AGAR|nr:ribosome recycling factor domain-containing protein [Crepidotus variabilis]
MATSILRAGLLARSYPVANTALSSTRSLSCLLTSKTILSTHAHWYLLQHRHYASKNKAKSTTSFVPGSKQPITDEAARQEYTKCEATMQAAVEYFRKECATSENRALGRITPALLEPVRVKLPDNPKGAKLEELATVGVREGSTLLITLFDEHTIKHVEASLYDCGIPGVVPHRQDNRTIKVPIPKPTIEARKDLFVAAKRKAEEIRVQVRKHHSASLKKGKYEKHSIELEEFQKLTDRYIKDTDRILADLQKATGVKA